MKRILGLMLILCLTLGCIAPASAAKKVKILRQPQTQTVKAGGKVTFSFKAENNNVITWYLVNPETGEKIAASKISSIFRTSKNEEDAKNAKVMRRATVGRNIDDGDDDGLKNFKVNSNVEIADHKKEKHGLLAKKSTSEEKPAVVDEPTTLLAVNDPNWEMPPMDLLSKKRSPADPGDTHSNAAIIKDTLEQFGINVEVEGANVGPRITQYTLRPPAGVKVSKIATLDRDLALNLAKDKIRIEAPIPGTRTVGIEIPNNKAASVGLHELLKSNEWHKIIADKPLAFAVGKDISGRPIMGNLAKMPHLLIAGTTGSGKSVMTNTLITSMLYHNSPADLRLIIIDPKQVEMAAYDAIPHLLAPVITNVSEAQNAIYCRDSGRDGGSHDDGGERT